MKQFQYPSKLKTPVLNEIVNKSIGRLEAKAAEKYDVEKKGYDSEKFILDTRIKLKKKEIEGFIKNENTKSKKNRNR